MVKTVIAATGAITTAEQSAAKKEADYLLVGKLDKSINVVSQGQVIPIKEISVATRTTTDDGMISTPTVEGLPFILKYGTAVGVSADSSVDITFTTPFPNRCFQVQLTHKGAGVEISQLQESAKAVDKFTLKRVGGTTPENVSWVAYGF